MIPRAAKRFAFQQGRNLRAKLASILGLKPKDYHISRRLINKLNPYRKFKTGSVSELRQQFDKGWGKP